MGNSSPLPFLPDEIGSFLAHMRSLGFQYDTGERILTRFSEHTASNFPGEVQLTREVAMAWAELRDGENPNTRTRRVSPVRGLAEHMIRHGGTAYVIPRNALSSGNPYVPYIYTAGEIGALFDACDRLAGGPRGGGYRLLLPCVMRLLYATGMRHGEARRLKVSDVDLLSGTIAVGPSKTSEGRLVYISDELCRLMSEFDSAMQGVAPNREYFFSKIDGGMQCGRWLDPSFTAAKCIAGIDEPGVVKRIHDLRHTFCVHRLNRWASEGKDVRAMLPYLSAYIGHKSLASTDYYLHLVPEFYRDYSTLTESRNTLIPECGSAR